MADTKTLMDVETFSISHSYHDSCCGNLVEMTFDELGIELDLTHLDREDGYAVHQAVLAAAHNAAASGNTEQAETFTEAAVRLQPCSQRLCDCSSYMFESEIEYFDEILADFPDHSWAVVDTYGFGYGFINQPLKVDLLFSATTIRYGYETVKLAWDGQQLQAEFSGYPWGSTKLRLVPLTGVRSEAYELWQTHFDWSDCEGTAAEIVCGDETVLQRLCAFDTTKFDDSISMESWVEVLGGIEPSNTTALAVAVEMLPDWPGEAEELVTTALACVA